MEIKKLRESAADQVSFEEHAALKNKVHDLEKCLHEMQEEFEEVSDRVVTLMLL